MELKVEYVPVDSIKPYAGNAKEHPQDQIEQIKQSIKEFGFNDPCAIWNGEIVEGHGRYEAAKQLGYTEIPVIRLDDLTDEQRRAYGLIHNQLTMNSGFDAEALEAELASISDIEMEVYGFSPDIEFASFDGMGDGGGSQIQDGDKVRVVIGATSFDISDPTHEIYDKTRNLNVETCAAWLAKALLSGDIEG
jgi:hypothetical protein